MIVFLDLRKSQIYDFILNLEVAYHPHKLPYFFVVSWRLQKAIDFVDLPLEVPGRL